MYDGDFFSIDLLQDYCLGLLTIDEEKEVLTMCYNFPALAKELQLLQSALEKYKSLHKMKHTTELSKSIWDAIKNMENEKS
jgi:hypothetical protein